MRIKMVLCGLANETYAVINAGIEKFMAIRRKNEIIGVIGKAFDSILAKKNLRQCTVIGRENLGTKSANGSYDGNLGLIQSGQAVAYLKSEAPLIQESFINYNIPFMSEKFVILEEITDSIKNNKINDMLNNLNFGFALTCSFLVSLLVSYLMTVILRSICTSRPKISFTWFKNILFKKFSIGHWLNLPSVSAFGLFLVSLNFYFWFARLMVLNNIKTNKVIVDKSILILNGEDALKSDKILCLLEGNTELSIATESPKENIFRRIYEERGPIIRPIRNLRNTKKGKYCILEKILDNIEIDPKGLFTVISETTLFALSGVIGSTRQGLVVWFDENPLYETNFHIIIRNEPDLVERFYQQLLLYTEAGIPYKLKNYFEVSSYTFFSLNTIYRTLEEFASANSKFDQLTVENFRAIFTCYAVFCFSILIICLLRNCSFKRLKRWRRKVRKFILKALKLK